MCKANVELGISPSKTNDEMKPNKKQKVDLDPLNDLIGQFGLYHLNLSLFIILREATGALDSLIFSLSLPKIDQFECLDQPQSNYLSSNQSEWFNDEGLDPRCYIMTNNADGPPEQCQNWRYLNDEFQDTLTVQWDLVCHRLYMGAILNSVYFFGSLMGNLCWGQMADKFGRWRAHSICHIGSLLFGCMCLLAPNFYVILLCRFGTAFCTVGYGILNTLQVEMSGTRCRSFITTANHFGWGLGVVTISFIGTWTNNWRILASVGPIFLLITLPWLFTLPESVRWLIINNQYDKAKKEIKRAAAFNLTKHKCTDEKIDLYLATRKLENEQKDENIIKDPEATSQKSQTKSRFIDLFINKVLLFNLIALSAAFFSTAYIYHSRTFDFAPDKESMMANFLITGIGEWVCLGTATLHMLFLKRKTCVFFFLTVGSFAFILEGYIMTYHQELYSESASVRYSLDGFAKLAGLSASMCLLLMSFEVFPTELRHSGSSMVMVFSNLGSVIAPFHGQLKELAGSRLNYSLIFGLIFFISAIVVRFAAQETKNVKLTERVGNAIKCPK